MKNDIKKYLTLGAVLAGSAFMVSCDGDDVTVTESTLNTTGLEQALIDANVKLPFNGLPSVFLPAARISAVINNIQVENDGDCVWPCDDELVGGLVVIERGDEFTIDFESVNFADFFCGGSNHSVNGTQTGDMAGNTASIDNLEVVAYSNDEATGQFSFSLKERDSNPDEIVLDTITFTVGGKLDYTLFGTFTSGATTCAEPNLNTENEHVLAISDLSAATAGGFAVVDAFLSGQGDATNLIEVTNEPNSTTGPQLAINTVVIRLDDPTTVNEDPVFVRTFTGTAPFDVSTINIATAPTVNTSSLPDGSNVFDVWTRICSTSTGCLLEGTFRADLNPSQGGIDQITVDGLIDDWLSENSADHTNPDGSINPSNNVGNTNGTTTNPGS